MSPTQGIKVIFYCCHKLIHPKIEVGYYGDGYLYHSLCCSNPYTYVIYYCLWGLVLEVWEKVSSIIGFCR
jgi:hypothetical protein